MIRVIAKSKNETLAPSIVRIRTIISKKSEGGSLVTHDNIVKISATSSFSED